MREHIITYLKIHFTPMDPKGKDIYIEDIAHALSLMTRANGHFPEFYSVAQHSIHCAEEALAQEKSSREALACLLHDGSEAYLSDITRPVKKVLPQYQVVEAQLQNAIYRKFIPGSLTGEELKTVKEIDDALLYYEFYHYMDEKLAEEAPGLISSPVFETRGFREVEQEFLQLFHKLMQ